MNRNSVRFKIILLDIFLFIPLAIISTVFMFMEYRRNENRALTSNMTVLEERSSTLDVNVKELYSIMNAFNFDWDINRMVSLKEKPTGYQLVSNTRQIQYKIETFERLYYQKQYQTMICSENGANYYQAVLLGKNADIDYSKIKEESWYQKWMKDPRSMMFISGSVSPELQKLFQPTDIIAALQLTNFISARPVGTIFVKIDKKRWITENLSLQKNENAMVVDPQGRILYSQGTDKTTAEEDSLLKESMEDQAEGNFNVEIAGKKMSVFYSDIGDSMLRLVTYMPVSHGLSQSLIRLGGFGLLTWLLTLILIYVNSSYINGRMQNINKSILKVTNGKLNERISGDYETEFRELCGNFNEMLDSIENLMHRLEKEEKEKYALEFRSLQSQINSHFIYNTLASIRYLIQMEEYDDADQSLVAFSRLLRINFADKRRIIPLSDETEMVKQYLKLMEIRYQGDFEWDISIPDEMGQLGIPKNTIQPIVENSISHGFSGKEDRGHIRITASHEGGNVIILVEDDGIGADVNSINEKINTSENEKLPEQFSEIGLSNIQSRIVFNFGKEYGLRAFRNAMDGVTIEIKIPETKVN